MEDEGKYFSRSWALLTRDKGWIKPILVMTAASLIPIVGLFGVQGYALEWARLTAWGVDSSPKQKNVDVGGCITSGARAFVVSLGLCLAVSVAMGIFTAVFSAFPDVLGILLGSLASLVSSLVTLVSGSFVLACQLRSAIYEQIGAGYRVDRVFEMIKRDTNGFARLVLLNFLCGLAVSVVAFIFIIIIVMVAAPVIMMAANSGSSAAIRSAVMAAIAPIIFVFALFILVCDFLGNGIILINATATALWFRKFDVASWGKSEDPLPEVGTSASWNPAAPAGVAERQGVRTQEQPLESKPVPETREPETREQRQPEDSAEGETTEKAPSQGLTEEVKDVDSLYADLYDVIQRDNHKDKDDD